MAMRHLVAKALRDDARILGLVLGAGVGVEIDVLEEQIADVQKAVDAGDVSVDGFAPSVIDPVVVDSPAPKAKGK